MCLLWFHKRDLSIHLDPDLPLVMSWFSFPPVSIPVQTLLPYPLKVFQSQTPTTPCRVPSLICHRTLSENLLLPTDTLVEVVRNPLYIPGWSGIVLVMMMPHIRKSLFRHCTSHPSIQNGTGVHSPPPTPVLPQSTDCRFHSTVL